MNTDKDTNILHVRCELGMAASNNLWYEGMARSKLYHYMLEHFTTATG
jgi:hypothetical protein